MRRKGQYFLALVVFLILSLLVTLFAKSNFLRPVQSAGEFVLLPIQKFVFGTFWMAHAGIPDKEKEHLLSENKRLAKKILSYKELEKENAALQDQFKNTSIKTTQLLPSHIVGMRSFIPGFSIPVDIILDKGRQEGVLQGMAVIVQDTVVGKIVRVSEHRSQVHLVTSTGSSVTAKTLEGNALGVVKGQGDETMLFDNVVLSDKIAIGDTVITGGDVDVNGLGYPPGLILGKITSLVKNPSALFQTAEVKTPISITHQQIVFIVLP